MSISFQIKLPILSGLTRTTLKTKYSKCVNALCMKTLFINALLKQCCLNLIILATRKDIVIKIITFTTIESKNVSQYAQDLGLGVNGLQTTSDSFHVSQEQESDASLGTSSPK